MIDINKETGLIDFPDIYNKNNKELLDIIDKQNQRIEAVSMENEKLKEQLTNGYKRFTTEIQNLLEKKMTEFEDKFQLKGEPL